MRSCGRRCRRTCASESTISELLVSKIHAYRPYSGWKHVDVSRYADGTQETTEPALNADEIVGIAVAMMTESSVETTTHSASPRKMGSSFRVGSLLVWSVSSTSGRTRGVAVPGVLCAVGVAVPAVGAVVEDMDMETRGSG